MTHSTPAADCREALEVGSDFTAEVTFYDVILFGNQIGKLIEFLLIEVTGTAVRIKTGFIYNGLGTCGPEAIDVAKRVNELFVGWNVDSKYTRHGTVVLIERY
jgi:hypothetical protein